MTAPEPTPRQTNREKQALALVESAGADAGAEREPPGDPSAPSMAVSIAGVSTACSKDALVSSARAVRRALAPE